MHKNKSDKKQLSKPIIKLKRLAFTKEKKMKLTNNRTIMMQQQINIKSAWSLEEKFTIAQILDHNIKGYPQVKVKYDEILQLNETAEKLLKLTPRTQKQIQRKPIKPPIIKSS